MLAYVLYRSPEQRLIVVEELLAIETRGHQAIVPMLGHSRFADREGPVPNKPEKVRKEEGRAKRKQHNSNAGRDLAYPASLWLLKKYKLTRKLVEHQVWQ